jgi:hypothetical protein
MKLADRRVGGLGFRFLWLHAAAEAALRRALSDGF